MQNENVHEKFAYLACLGFTLIFCCHYLVAKIVLQHVDVIALAATRGVIGGAILCGVFWRSFRGIALRLLLTAIPVGLFGFCVNQLLFLQGLSQSKPADAAVLSNLIPLVSTAMAIFFGLENFRLKNFAGLVIGFTAVAIYLSYLLGATLVDHAIGNAMIVMSVFSLSTALAIAKKYLRDLPSPVMSGLMLLIGGVILTVFAGRDLGTVWSYTFESHLSFGFMAFEVLISTAIAYFLNLYALKHLPVSRTMVFAYFQPVFTAGLVFVFYDRLPSLALIPLFLAILFSAYVTLGEAGNDSLMRLQRAVITTKTLAPLSRSSPRDS